MYATAPPAWFVLMNGDKGETPPILVDVLLLEDGDKLLLEDGGQILLENPFLGA